METLVLIAVDKFRLLRQGAHSTWDRDSNSGFYFTHFQHQHTHNGLSITSPQRFHAILAALE